MPEQSCSLVLCGRVAPDHETMVISRSDAAQPKSTRPQLNKHLPNHVQLKHESAGHNRLEGDCQCTAAQLLCFVVGQHHSMRQWQCHGLTLLSHEARDRN